MPIFRVKRLRTTRYLSSYPDCSLLGFTLIELLLVVAIIAVLMAVGIPSYTKFLARGRDSKRQSDLKSIQSVLAQYRVDQSYYPVTVTQDQPLRDPAAGKTYLQKVPKEPLSTGPVYSYVPKPTGCDNSNLYKLCTSYCLYAQMEDASIAQTDSKCPTVASYNYQLTPP